MAYFRDLSLDFVWILCYDHVILITPSSLIQVSLSLSLSLSLSASASASVGWASDF
jgi:hypothetical protein